MEVPCKPSSVLAFGHDTDGRLCVWAAVRTGSRGCCAVTVIATGKRMSKHAHYVGHARDGQFLWHAVAEPLSPALVAAHAACESLST